MATQVSRDPFARETLMREVAIGTRQCMCAWCGQYRTVRRDGQASKRNLFRYGVLRDGRGSIDWDRDTFCSKACFDTYHHN